MATHAMGRKQAAADFDRTQAETVKLQAEATKMLIEIDESRAAAVRNIADARSFQAEQAAASVIFDSRKGFDPFDFRTDAWEGAEGRLGFEDEKILSLHRDNVDGRFVVWLRAYTVDGDRSEIIPPKRTTDARRRLHVHREVRAIGGDHTLLLRLKAPTAPPGEYLARWRQPITSDAWVPIDAFFEYVATVDSAFRFDDRSVSHAPSYVQIRNLILTEKTSGA